MLRRLEKGKKKKRVTEQYLTGIQTSNDFKNFQLGLPLSVYSKRVKDKRHTKGPTVHEHHQNAWAEMHYSEKEV